MADAPTDPLRFADRFAIGELAADYASCVDRRELERLVELFTADGELVLYANGEDAPPTAVRSGRDELHGAMQSLGRYDLTAHHLAQHRIRFRPPGDDGAPRASGELHATAHHVLSDGDSRTDRVLTLRYLDDYVVDGGRWRFSRRRLITDIVDVRPL